MKGNLLSTYFSTQVGSILNEHKHTCLSIDMNILTQVETYTI